MQPCDGKCECSKKGDSDGRRDVESPTDSCEGGMGCAEVTYKTDRTVCLSASITGKGDFSL